MCSSQRSRMNSKSRRKVFTDTANSFASVVQFENFPSCNSAKIFFIRSSGGRFCPPDPSPRCAPSPPSIGERDGVRCRALTWNE